VIGGTLSAPRPSGKAKQDDARRTLAELSVPSESGNEHPAMERVAEAVEELGLLAQRLERLKTAVAEATMNAMEHGSTYRSEVPVVIQVLFRVLNRRESQLAIVVFMLAIAVLISPPGLGIQLFIDRRFQQHNLERRSRT
jgi:anti-sigma regulatory factor (Ser/Thr protein kinase)